jgi:uncharacterized protein (TIGR02246 family)
LPDKVMTMKAVRTDQRDFIAYPTNRVVGAVGDADKARAAVDALLQAGFRQEDIDILHGEEDLQRLDPTGAAHGLLAQFQRKLIRSLELEEFKHLSHHIEDVRAGQFVIMVLTKRRALRIAAADILHQHGAEFVGFYGRWSCEELPESASTSPAEIPALFARAWNGRDPNALASLFEEDAEFVDVTGMCWHGRESMRKAHAGRDELAFSESTLTAGDTTVKVLSPEVAVVHSRLTHSGGQPAGPVAPAEPRTTIACFVVHRAGDRWLCASAQTTDVIPDRTTNVLHQAGELRLANTPSEQAP